jgi:hypothetical protein
VVSEAVTRICRTAEQMRAYLSIDAFTAELAGHPETRESAPVAVAVVLAVTGRTREARERARQVPGDFADRLERWLAGERPPPLWESEDDFAWGEALTAAFRKARAVTPEERAQRPQSSWRDVWRTARTLRSALHGELPRRPRLPDRERAWHDVELNSDAAAVLERAHQDSPLVIFVDAFAEAGVEPGIQAGRLRVLIDGVEIGSLSAPDDATPAAVPARLRRTRPGAPLTLAVQLPNPGVAAHD